MDPSVRILREARRTAGFSQRELAARARTSGPTVAAYESGRIEPRLSTLRRLLRAAGQRLLVETAPLVPLTREERRSLLLHEAIAEELLARPQESIERARNNLRTMRRADVGGRASPWLDEWERLLGSGDVRTIVEVMTDPDDPNARELRQNTPFAGILAPRARWNCYRRFRELER